MTWDNVCLASAVMRPSSGSKIFQVPLTRDRIALNVSEPEGMLLRKDSTKPMQRAALRVRGYFSVVFTRVHTNLNGWPVPDFYPGFAAAEVRAKD